MDESDMYARLGQLVRQHRERLNLSQQALADAIKLSRASIANIEAGRQHIALHQLYRLARALKVDASTLLPRADADEPPAAVPKIKSSQALSEQEQVAIARAVDSA